jgi:hypothetical protein
MPDFRAAEKHGPIREVFPDVFMVESGFRFAPGFGITRNMFVVRQGSELTVISSARLSVEGEAELEKLGKVAHVIRIGGFHGADDPYWLDRYKATFWSPPGLANPANKDRDLVPGSSPIEDAEVFAFGGGNLPEAALLLKREGGILITADSYQNWTTFEGCTLLARGVTRLMGFGPTVIGGPWVKRQGPGIRKDFDRLVELEFAHLLPGHGTALKSEAKAGLRTAIAHRFR